MATLRKHFEYAAVFLLVASLRRLPRRLARNVAAVIGALGFVAFRRMRRVADRNLQIAWPSSTSDQRNRILRRMFHNLSWQMAEFCLMSRYTVADVERFARVEGMEHYLDAKARGRGVLIVTGHIGAWELSSFYHSLLGHPMSMVIRRLDNVKVDGLVNRIRCQHGNRVLHKDEFARGLLSAMRANETVGILMDTNMTPPQGVFVPFFGVPACTASGLARVALKTGATVLLGYMVWEETEQKYVLRFSSAIPLMRTGDSEADIVANTAQFTLAIENAVRQYPDQWLWVHRRWKTRPPGEPAIY